MQKAITIIIFIIMGSSMVFSQKSKGEPVTVRGSVSAFEHFQLMNVEITAKKTKTKVLTDSLGEFEIMAKKGDILLFSANGFEKNRRKVTERNEKINVNMILIEGEKHKKVAVGYGHMSEADLTYAIQNYSALNNDYLKYTDMQDMLSRELVGVTVVDQGGLKVYSRGSQNTMNTGISSNTGESLFVLNGVIVPTIDHLSPRDIKSISMLKGNEAAIYGSRAANGVVLIETK